MIIIYIIVSILVGITDLVRLADQENYLADVPYGDLEFYDPKPITGIHNWVLFPSWIVIKGWMLFARLVNKIIDG